MHYTVVAYRWGWTNAERRQVAQSSDADRACELAQEDCDDSGGKYGVAVLEWSDETSCQLYAYYPSSYGEDAPHENQRIGMFEGIGHDIHGAVTTLTLWDPPAESRGFNEPRAVLPPDWVTDIVRKREQRRRFMDAVFEDIDQRRASALPQRPEEERQRWIQNLTADIAKTVDALLAQGPEHQRNALEQHSERVAKRAAAAVPPT